MAPSDGLGKMQSVMPDTNTKGVTVVTGKYAFMTQDFSDLIILVVDDNANMRKLVRTLLATMCIKDIKEAESATTAIMKLHEHDVDVVITDLSMLPMNGIDLVSKVRMGRDSPNPHVPVIMLTDIRNWNWCKRLAAEESTCSSPNRARWAGSMNTCSTSSATRAPLSGRNSMWVPTGGSGRLGNTREENATKTE